MTVPVYHYYSITKSTVKEEIEEIQKLPISKAPIVFEFDQISTEAAIKFITDLKNEFWDQEINTTIPYPIYFIHPDMTDHDNGIYTSRETLPKFFNLNPKSPGPMESEVLNKVEILQDKINNLIKKDALQKLTLPMYRHQKLFKITKETVFFENMLALENENTHAKK